MNTAKRVLLLVGSAKQQTSTSEAIGTCLLERLHPAGFETETLFTHKASRSDEAMAELIAAVARADLIVLAFPLYVDCLPYTVINALEHIRDSRRSTTNHKDQSLLCIVNCGFPEAHQNETALAICRQFARETGFTWSGGLALGAGGVIHGRPLREVGGAARNVMASLDVTADALIRSEQIPKRAVDLMARPLVWKWVYLWYGSRGWRRVAKRNGVLKALGSRPYQKLI
ncbi:MAG: NAD(P)H-dependent oxidoreductase [candidate division Zixibacteria bacterium]|nr:NAD(P)H-dependent oxidoreductase [candidate division Zixibacteria bacterium]